MIGTILSTVSQKFTVIDEILTVEYNSIQLALEDATNNKGSEGWKYRRLIYKSKGNPVVEYYKQTKNTGVTNG